MVYSWEKVDGTMADNVKFSDLNRVVTIEKASFQNEGVYRCIVKRGRSSRAEKEYTLLLSGIVHSLRVDYVRLVDFTT